MSDLATHVTGQRYDSDLPCPVCGRPATGFGRSGAYCGDEHYVEARRRALAGEPWEPHESFRALVRRVAQTGVANNAGTSTRTRQRRAKQAMAT